MARNNYPNRGPRVMHGMGKMLAQAQDIADRLQPPGQPVVKPPAVDKVFTDLAAAHAAAEARIARATAVIAAFRKQVEGRPEDDFASMIVRTVLNTVEEALK